MSLSPLVRTAVVLWGTLLLGTLSFSAAARAQAPADIPDEPPPGLAEEQLPAEPASEATLGEVAESSSAQVEDTEPAVREEEIEDDEAPLDEPEEAAPYVGIEEIVVTGQRRSQNLQEVPVSVTAFTPQEIAGANMKDIRDLAEYTPNLEIKTAFAASNPTLFIRGVGLNDFNANSASAVAVYVDDIYMQSPAGQLAGLFDLENVEILRGPQGSLYGRNASAGAIRVVSRKPTEDFDLFGSMTYGRFNQLEFEGAVGGSVIPSYLAARGAFTVNMRDGITRNGCGGLEGEVSSICGGQGGTPTIAHILPDLPKWVNDTKNWAGRGSALLWLDALDMEWLWRVHGSQNRGDATQYQHIGASQVHGSDIPRLDTFDAMGYMECAVDTDGTCPQKEEGNPDRGRQRDTDPFTGDYNSVGDELLDLWGTSLTGSWGLADWLELTSITGYEWHDRETDENSDASPNEMIEVVWGDDAWQVSQEIRLTSDLGGPLEWVAGGFYLQEDLHVLNQYRVGFQAAPARSSVVYQEFEQNTWTWALFGHLWYELFDDLTLEGGARYNWERKTFDISNELVGGGGSGVPIQSGSEKATWSAFSGDISLNYVIFEGTNVYLKYSRGFKGGHFNGGAITSSAIVEPVEPETVDSFEIGLKAGWFDRRLVLNVTGFYYRYDNLQVFQLEQAPNGFPVVQLINANDARVYGVEVDLHARPLPGLDIRYNFGWLESEYLDFSDSYDKRRRGVPEGQCLDELGGTWIPPGICDYPVNRDFTGNRLVSSPQFAMSAIVEYELPLTFRGDWGSLFPRYDFTFKSDVFFDPGEGTGANQWFPEGTLGQEGYWLHNARLAYRTPNDKLEVAGWIRNIADTRFKVDSFDVSNEFQYLIYVPGDPRTYGFTVSYQF